VRHAMLAGSPIVSVPVVHEGWVADKDVPSLVQRSLWHLTRAAVIAPRP